MEGQRRFCRTDEGVSSFLKIYKKNDPRPFAKAYKEAFSHVWNGVVLWDCTIPAFMLLLDVFKNKTRKRLHLDWKEPM